MNLTMKDLTKRAFCLAIILSTLAEETFAAKKQEEESRTRAQALWEQAIASKGGRARLHGVNSLLISY